MPKKSLKGIKQTHLRKRGRELLAQEKKKQTKRKKQVEIQQNVAKAKKRKLEKEAKSPYKPEQKLLLVGEGNFSFSRALVDTLGAANAKNIIATSLDTDVELDSKYDDATANVSFLQLKGGHVLHGVDGRKLDEIKLPFVPDRIIFNFPHTGSGIKDTAKNIAEQQALVRSFFLSAVDVVNPEGGEIHVTIKKGEPYDSWKVSALATETGRLQLKTAIHFFPSLYPGYQHRRTLGYHPSLVAGADPSEDFIAGAKTYIFILKSAEGEKPKSAAKNSASAPPKRIRRKNRKPTLAKPSK